VLKVNLEFKTLLPTSSEVLQMNHGKVTDRITLSAPAFVIKSESPVYNLQIKKPSFFADKRIGFSFYKRTGGQYNNIMLKTKMAFFILALLLITPLIFSSCTLNHLRPGALLMPAWADLIEGKGPGIFNYLIDFLR
jgi:hypothetical protein